MDLEGESLFPIIPEIFPVNSNLDFTSRVVFRKIFSLMLKNSENDLIASDIEIGELINISSRSVARAIKLLEDQGIITRTYKVNRRTIHLGKEWIPIYTIFRREV